ncbi:MAG: hypothetical protein HYU30_10540 [Chloroflexi bacterium]|nr:hypothetical protein [Chloroflexota bacterium]
MLDGRGLESAKQAVADVRSHYLDLLDKSHWGFDDRAERLLQPDCGGFSGIGFAPEGCWVAKEVFCAREWCGKCGRQEGPAHNRRIARWLPKFQQADKWGYFVLTLPMSVRDKYRRKASLEALGRKAKAIFCKLGYERGLRRWHLFGDDHRDAKHHETPKYHPHLNVLLPDVGYLSAADIQRVKSAWAALLGVDSVVVHYKYLSLARHGIGKLYHLLSYVTRPTFTDWHWDERLALDLLGLHLGHTWGTWKGEPMWELSGGKEAVPEKAQIEAGYCRHGEPLTWVGVVPTSHVTGGEWRDIGDGYRVWYGPRVPPMPDKGLGSWDDAAKMGRSLLALARRGSQ